VVYRLNHALWDLVLDVKHPGDEKMNPIMPSRHSSQYDVRFSVLKKAGGAEDIESRRSERKAGEHVSRGRVRVNGKFRDLPHREEPDRGSAIENHISNNDEINRDDEAPDDGPAGC
jgi:hypothetical protein